MPLDAADADVGRRERSPDQTFEIPLRARDAAEHVQADAAVFRERVAGQMRFGEHLHAGETAGVWKPMPGCGCHRRQVRRVEDRAEQGGERLGVAEQRRITPDGVDDPLDPGGCVQS